MIRLLGFSFSFVVLLLVLAASALAHQSGCHAAHSCPSDTGSYVCGDTGNYNFCPALAGSVTLNASAPTVGTILSASSSWTAYATVAYQWKRAGVDIPGAFSSSYSVALEDLGLPLTLMASASDGRGQLASATSAPVTPTASIRLSLQAARVKAGKLLVFRGSASSVVDVGGRAVKVKLWQRQGRRWKLKRTASVTTDSFGDFVVKQKTPARKSTAWKAQATFAGDGGLSKSSSRAVSVSTK